MSFTVATFNVKDLLDADHPIWRDPTLRAAKIAVIARDVAELEADVLCLQEVGSDRTLGELDSALPVAQRYPHRLVGTPDARGIRCAVLARRPLRGGTVHTARSLPFPAFAEGDPPPFGDRIPLRRGVVQARVDGGALGEIEVFVGHFKSSRPVAFRRAGARDADDRVRLSGKEAAEGHLRSLVWRAAEALFVRSKVDDVLARDPRAHVVVAGDFNDGPSSMVVRVLRAGEDGRGERGLVACAERVPLERRFSHLRRGERLQIDHLLATPGLARHLLGCTFHNEHLRDHGEIDDAAPPAIDSDHAALTATFSDDRGSTGCSTG